jgi:hypothetical protein
VLGKYIISDKPMTIEQWAAERRQWASNRGDDEAWIEIEPGSIGRVQSCSNIL